MNISRPRRNISASEKQAIEHFDVLVVGAGISGIGSAYHLKRQLSRHEFRGSRNPGKIFGGHLGRRIRYPGIRSDSDLHTFRLTASRPWVGPPIASRCPKSLSYMDDVIAGETISAKHIRYQHRIEARGIGRVMSNLWDHRSGQDRTVAKAVDLTANFLWMCQGYYRHSEGFTPEWPDNGQSSGAAFVHPQRLARGYRHPKARRVVVIGSGPQRRRRLITCDRPIQWRAYVTMLQPLADLFQARPQTPSKLAEGIAPAAGSRRSGIQRDRAPPRSLFEQGPPSPSAA